MLLTGRYAIDEPLENNGWVWYMLLDPDARSSASYARPTRTETGSPRPAVNDPVNDLPCRGPLCLAAELS